jgi:hypothetical protein
MIHNSVAQVVGVMGLATIFEKMELFWAFCRSRVAIEAWWDFL